MNNYISRKKYFALACAISVCVASTTTLAVNGAFDYGFSEITRGMAGAGSALPQDSLIAAINPAGMVWVKHQLDVGAVIYFPTMSYDATSVNTAQVSQFAVAPGHVDSNVAAFFLPDFGVNIPLDNKSSLGLSIYSLGGFGARYDTSNGAYIAGAGTSFPGALGNGQLRSNLKQGITSLTYSRKVLKRSSWGVSLLMGLQSIQAKGIANLASLSAHPNQLNDQGVDYSIGGGVRFGFLFGLSPSVDLSVSYEPKVYMTKLTDYAGLLANGGQFDIPAFGNIGFAWHMSPSFVLAGDIEKVWFKDVPTYGSSNDALVSGNSCASGADTSTCMGGKNGAGFGWNNGVFYKIGAQWEITDKTTLRAGFNHGNKIESSDYATENMITPGALIRNLFTFGATEKINKKNAINAMVVFIPKQSIRSANKFSGAANQVVTINAQGFGVGVSWSHLLS